MQNYRTTIQLRWADIDANRHLRHSAYYDYGALCRIRFLTEHGLSVHVLEKIRLGPVLFREEAIFKREIHFEDEVQIDTTLKKARRDYSRWTIQHHFFKKGDELAAVLTVEGAWIDLVKRKLGVPTTEVIESFAAFPKPPDFEWLD